MPRLVVLAIPTLSQQGAARTRALIESAKRGGRVPDVFFVIDNGGRFGEEYGVVTLSPGSNLGVGPAWNRALLTFPDAHVVLANDDLVLGAHTIGRLVHVAEESPDDVAIVGAARHTYSAFIVRAEAVRRVGLFDEGFAPAYFEDADYERRLSLAGMRVVREPIDSWHDEQSTSREIGHDSALKAPYWKSSEARYSAKWGAGPGGETFSVPWGIEVDVVVPSRRRFTLPRLLRSLAWQTVRPRRVWIVSNDDLSRIDPCGLDVRQLRFDSSEYAIGEGDVSLRRNIGTWASGAACVVYSDDDQVWPQAGIEWFVRYFARGDAFVVGHHRFVPETMMSDARLRTAAPEIGRAREDGQNRQHGWQSCYAGALGFRRETLIESGGWDLSLSRGEDQQLALRLMGAVTFVREPPFAWHPDGAIPLDPEPGANTCRSLGREHVMTSDGDLDRCTACPRTVSRNMGKLAARFDPRRVQVEEIRLGA